MSELNREEIKEIIDGLCGIPGSRANVKRIERAIDFLEALLDEKVSA